MAGNRRVFEQIILDGIDAITLNKQNVEFYRKKFASMSDADMERFVQDLESGKVSLSIVEPNFSKAGYVPSEKIMAVAEKHGYKFMQRLWIEGKEGRPTYLTPVEYPVYLVPVRRASQLLAKKISVPPHSKVRDMLTGQVTGESKGATLSGPEVQLLGGMGANFSAIEKMKYTGGDARGEAAYIAMLSRYGRANQSVLNQFSSGVQAINAVNTFLTAAMHRVNL